MAQIDLQEIAEFAKATAKQAGDLIAEMRTAQSFEQSFKDQNELVTSADLAADKLIISAIQSRYPNHRILSEETYTDRSAVKNLNDPLWIIDPIDGTVNYAHGHFMVAVSIAFACDGDIQMGVVHNPFLKTCFHAVKGQGGQVNGEAISVSGADRLDKAIIATGFPYAKDTVPMLSKRLLEVMMQCADIRRLGSAAMDICWVACGKLDGYYESLSPWDFAAARLIAQEAGATCGHFSPVPEDISPSIYDRDLLICSPGIYQPLRGLLEQTCSQ